MPFELGVPRPHHDRAPAKPRQTAIQRCQPTDGDRTEALPPLDFSWTAFEPRGRRFLPLQGSDLPTQSLANPGLELVDLFGDGTPDFLEMTCSTRYWRNLGDGRFDLPRPMTEAPGGLSLADPGVQLIDANGDGRADLAASLGCSRTTGTSPALLQRIVEGPEQLGNKWEG